MEDNKTTAEIMADITSELLDFCLNNQEKIAINLGLTVSEFKTLRLLKKDQMISVGDLAKKMNLSNSRLTRIIDGLFLKSIIRRDIGTHDRRVMEIMLTKEGLKITQNLNEQYIKSQQYIVDHFEPGSEKDVLAALMNLSNAIKLSAEK